MTRYERVKEILDSKPKEQLRMCPTKGGGCACIGCVEGLGIRESELEWYLKQSSPVA